MSERKSWDIQPKRSAPTAAPVAPTRRVSAAAPKRPLRPAPSRPAAKPPKMAAPSRERVAQGKNREPLRQQRIRARKRARIFLVVAALFVIVGLYASVWLSVFRVQHVDAAGPDSEGMQSIAMQQLQGTYEYVIPRDSILVVPVATIREDIEKAYPDIAAVSVHRSSFSSIAIESVSRVASFTWCGIDPTAVSAAPELADSSSTPSSSNATTTSSNVLQPVVPHCFAVDSQGFIFAPVTTPDDRSVLLYGALAQASSTPIGNTVQSAGAIPDALQFVKALSGLGITIQTLVLRGDEADLYTPKGTRITYVLGREQDAADLAQAALPSLDVDDGSLDYVDLRFADKVYYMKKGAESEPTASSTAQ